jgi:hypothetical protein
MGVHLFSVVFIYWGAVWIAMARCATEDVAGRAITLPALMYIYYVFASCPLILLSGILWKVMPAGPSTLILLFLHPVTAAAAIAVAIVGAVGICFWRRLAPFGRTKS